MAKKKMRKDVLVARIIFTIILLIVISAIVVVALVLHKNKPTQTPNTQTSQMTEAEDSEWDSEPIVESESADTQEESQVEETEADTEEETQIEETHIQVWTTDLVNLRKEPNTDCEVLTRVPRNTELVQLGEKSGFALVEYNDNRGYISLDYITTEEPTTNGIVICIDPGHQRSGDSTQEPNGPNSSTMKARVTGGTSGSTLAEYELTLMVSLKLQAELESRGYTVCMTRTSHDVNISNMERAQYATNMGANVTIRIHANGSESASASGACALVPSSSNPYVANLASASNTLGKCILNSYCSATGIENDGVVGSDNMTGINWCTMPVAILEMGYMSNANDDAYMSNESNQYTMVRGIADGLDAYFGF